MLPIGFMEIDKRRSFNHPSLRKECRWGSRLSKAVTFGSFTVEEKEGDEASLQTGDQPGKPA